MNNSRVFAFLISWYFIPFFYLIIFKGIFLPYTGMCLVIFFLSFLFAMIFGNIFIVESSSKVPDLKLFIIFAKLLFVLQFYAFLRFAVRGVNLITHRNLIWDDPYYLLGHPILFTLYINFFIPFILVFSIFLIALNNPSFKKLQNFCLLLLFLDSLLMFGRFQILFILFLLILKAITKKVNFFILFLLSSLLLVVTQIIIYLRQFISDSSLESATSFITFDYIESSIISYQYYGYFILEKLISDASIFGNFFPMYTLNFLIYCISLVLTKFGILISNPWENINLQLSEGYYISSIDTSINAFSTNFLPIYLDFGIIGIISWGICSGLIMGVKGNSNTLKFIKFLCLFILIFGIYQPIILNFYGLILFIAICYLIIRKLKIYS